MRVKGDCAAERMMMVEGAWTAGSVVYSAGVCFVNGAMESWCWWRGDEYKRKWYVCESKRGGDGGIWGEVSLEEGRKMYIEGECLYKQDWWLGVRVEGRPIYSERGVHDVSAWVKDHGNGVEDGVKGKTVDVSI